MQHLMIHGKNGKITIWMFNMLEMNKFKKEKYFLLDFQKKVKLEIKFKVKFKTELMVKIKIKLDNNRILIILKNL